MKKTLSILLLLTLIMANTLAFAGNNDEDLITNEEFFQLLEKYNMELVSDLDVTRLQLENNGLSLDLNVTFK